MENENNILFITDENGNEVKIEVLDIFSIDDYPGKEYIFYTKGEVSNDEEYEQTYVSILREDENSATLEAIEDELEFTIVQKHINQTIKRELGDE
ncbi:MAG: DUF1292 domain-containing protein [Bacilli bacterium]|nr:DUF1292 domain-containing protein [Bacilli bacterium]